MFFIEKVTGTLADVGGFSLNYHKHIHTGEGGILVTNNSKIYERLLLIRNHAEAAVVGKKEKNLSNMVGYNFRLGEIEAAIGIEQLKKLNKFIKNRQAAAKFLTKKSSKIRIFTNSYCFKIQYSCLLYLSTNFGRKKLKNKKKYNC